MMHRTGDEIFGRYCINGIMKTYIVSLTFQYVWVPIYLHNLMLKNFKLWCLKIVLCFTRAVNMKCYYICHINWSNKSNIFDRCHVRGQK